MLTELPSLETIETLSEASRAKLLARLDAEVAVFAPQYKGYQAAAEAALEAKKQALALWEQENAALIAEAKAAQEQADAAKAALQQAAVVRHMLTGEKTAGCLQIAEVPKADYDPTAMLTWVLTQAPGGIRQQLVKLDTTAVNKFVLGLEEKGSLRVIEGAAPVPAIIRTERVGKVLNNVIGALVTPVGAPLTIQVVEVPAALTSGYVAERVGQMALAEATQSQIERAAQPETDDIPF